MTPTAKAALFDIDGTLIDSNDLHAQAWHEAIAKFGADVPVARIRPQIGKGGDYLLPAVLPQEFLEANGEALEEYRGEIFARDYMPRIKPFPEVRTLFQKVADAGIKIVLASSGTEQEVAHHLELIGCEDLVEETTSADDAERSKPAPDIFAAALAKLQGIPGEHAVVVGDSPYDMQAAKALGVRTIGLRCGGFSDEVLTSAGCDILFDDPADLLRRFGESPFSAV